MGEVIGAQDPPAFEVATIVPEYPTATHIEEVAHDILVNPWVAPELLTVQVDPELSLVIIVPWAPTAAQKLLVGHEIDWKVT